MSYWAVVQTEARMLIRSSVRDASLAEYLFARDGYESYLPQVKSKQHGRNRIAPLFPGYIFARIVDRWYPIAWTMGVVRVLMSGDQPARLPDDIVNNIRSREIGGFVRLPKKQMALKIGQPVRIASGQFIGHQALYDGQSTQERERVLLDMLGGRVRVELAKGDRVEPLEVLASTQILV